MQAYNYLCGFGNLYIIISALYFSQMNINQILSKVGFHNNTSSNVLMGK